MKILMGDFNAQIGPDQEGWEEVIGGMAEGERTDNGDRLMSICSIYNLKIGGSFFRHRKVHKQTWRSPDGKTCNQIDLICVQGRWMSSLSGCTQALMWIGPPPVGGQAKGETKDTSRAEGKEEEYGCGDFRN